jgi:putative endonuclease
MTKDIILRCHPGLDPGSSKANDGYMAYYVYILTNKRNGTLYVGVTNNIIRRMTEHRDSRTDTFTQRYGTTRLVYLEPHDSIEQAIARARESQTLAQGLETRFNRE